MDARSVGARTAEYAIGSLSGMANNNPPLLVPGLVPILGYHLSVDWKYIIALVACIAGVHTVFVVLLLWIARPVVIVDDSNLCTARLLSGLVNRLDDGGCLLDGREIAEAIKRRDGWSGRLRGDKCAWKNWRESFDTGRGCDRKKESRRS
jgi:hypothetical protein